MLICIGVYIFKMLWYRDICRGSDRDNYIDNYLSYFKKLKLCVGINFFEKRQTFLGCKYSYICGV